MNNFEEAQKILSSALDLFQIKDFEGKKLKNFEIFKALHYHMGVCYYYQYEFKNALKCFKYVLHLFYHNTQYFVNQKAIDSMLPKFYLKIGKVFLKQGEID